VHGETQKLIWQAPLTQPSFDWQSADWQSAFVVQAPPGQSRETTHCSPPLHSADAEQPLDLADPWPQNPAPSAFR
jgi:hypothetical protein